MTEICETGLQNIYVCSTCVQTVCVGFVYFILFVPVYRLAKQNSDIFARNALYMQNNLLIRWIKQYAHKHFLFVEQHILIMVHDWNFRVILSTRKFNGRKIKLTFTTHIQ